MNITPELKRQIHYIKFRAKCDAMIDYICFLKKLVGTEVIYKGSVYDVVMEMSDELH